MKKLLKGETLVYNVRSSEQDSNFIGTRHWMIRAQHVTTEIKQALAGAGLFGEGAISNGSEITAPDVTKIFPSDLPSEYQELTKTPLIYKEGKIEMVVFLLPDGTNVFANRSYVEEVEALFQPTKKSPLLGWRTKGGNEPLIYGNRLALVLPYRHKDSYYKVSRL